jgi:hypothetical protein
VAVAATTFFLIAPAQTHVELHWVSLEEDFIKGKRWTDGKLGRQAQVERSTRTSAIEPNFRIDDGLFLWTSKIVELGNLNGLVKLIRLETLTATAPTFQLERFHFSSQIPRSKNSRL